MRKILPSSSSSVPTARVIGYMLDSIGLGGGGLLAWRAVTQKPSDWTLFGLAIGSGLSCIVLGVGLVILAEIVENVRIIAHNTAAENEEKRS